MRKLVTLRTVKELRPIENADNIELAIVDGWQCVVKKGEFSVGDTGIYFEIDSVLPADDRWSFLENSKYRVRTIRLRGQLSQGLLLPMSIVNQDERLGILSAMGDDSLGDLSDVFGVIKYEAPIPAELSGIMKGGFPSFISRTDEERIQNLSDSLCELSKHSYVMTEKLAGTSSTFYLNNGGFGVCSRNLELVESDTNTLWKIAKQLNIKDVLHSLGGNWAIQGEVIGEGIQKNVYKLKGQHLRVFNLFNIDTQERIGTHSMRTLLGRYGIESVPILGTTDLPKTVDEILSMAEGRSELFDTEREGIVFRSLDGKISFKAISNKYLLKEK